MLSELNHAFSLIGLSETKIKSALTDNNVNFCIPGYEFYSQPSLSNAGGVGFFVSKKLSFTLRADLSCSENEYEALWIEIQCELQHNLICGVIYRHPKGNVESFLEYLNTVVDKVSNENKYCTIMGDFNIDLLNASHPSTNEFLNTLETNSFNPHILQPTRITDHSETLIDNIFFNSLSHHTISGNIIYDISDHLPNFLIINKFSALPKQFKISKRDYSNFNENEFLQDIRAIDWVNKLTSNDPSTQFDNFYTMLLKVVDKHIPLKQLSNKEIKQLSKPWITKGLLVSIKMKNKLYRKYLKKRSSYYYEEFKRYRNKLNHLIKLSKQSYYNNYFASNRSNLKNTWKGIKEIIGLKNGNCSLPSKVLSPDNEELNDCLSIANRFNSYFTSIENTISSSIPSTSQSPMDTLPCKTNENFYFSPIEPNEIEEEISNLNNRKSTGPYSIPVYILKLISSIISNPLAIIFNSSLSAGVVPKSFKLSSVIPIFKKGSQLDVGNYRPIFVQFPYCQFLTKSWKSLFSSE